MYRTCFFTLLLALVSTLPALAQSDRLQRNAAWIQKQLNEVADRDDDGEVRFALAGCDMAMTVANKKDAKDDVSFALTISWLLKDVRKVSYTKDKDSKGYTLHLDVPADRLSTQIGLGKDNNISGSFNMKDDDKKKPSSDSQTNISLDTKDEELVKAIVAKLQDSVQLCKGGK